MEDLKRKRKGMKKKFLSRCISDSEQDSDRLPVKSRRSMERVSGRKKRRKSVKKKQNSRIEVEEDSGQ